MILVRKNKRGEGVLCRKLKVVTRQRSKESGTLNVLKQHFFYLLYYEALLQRFGKQSQLLN